jgi:hypothetical protein
MTRTPGDIARRRVIAEAAGAFPAARTAVVLYACIAPDQRRDEVRDRLRRHAEARDWVVVAEVIDHVATATPLKHRPNWPLVLTYIATQQAEGIVATAHTARAGDCSSPPLGERLHAQGVFLFEETPTPREAAR